MRHAALALTRRFSHGSTQHALVCCAHTSSALRASLPATEASLGGAAEGASLVCRARTICVTQGARTGASVQGMRHTPTSVNLHVSNCSTRNKVGTGAAEKCWSSTRWAGPQSLLSCRPACGIACHNLKQLEGATADCNNMVTYRSSAFSGSDDFGGDARHCMLPDSIPASVTTKCAPRSRASLVADSSWHTR